MGGADKKNIISKLAKIFSNKFFNKFKFSLLTNRNKVKKLHQILNKNINFKIIYQKKKNLYDLASKHKYIISNMGLSMYEFAYAKKKYNFDTSKQSS